MLPVDGHHAQGERFEAQIASKIPLRKRLWSQVVTAKVGAQAQVLENLMLPAAPLWRMKTEIKSGDTGNVEARAAQYYLPSVFGSDFRRNREAAGANTLLNYGYTVLRAATARAIVAAGLHPSIGLFHKSRGDAFRLADDLMEPFRPTVDLTVCRLLRNSQHDLDTETKQALVGVLRLDFETAEGRSPLSNCLARFASSLAQTYLRERESLLLPNSLVPLADEPVELTE
jgi:CRISPR-associated protein Cas1